MLQDIAPHVYHNEFTPRTPEKSDWVMSFSEHGLLCRVENGSLRFPTVRELGTQECRYLFSVDERGCFLRQTPPQSLPDGWNWENTRQLRGCVPDEKLFAMAAAESLWRWYGGNRFCGCCGAAMEDGTTERSRVCPVCGHTVYPKICPAVIVAVYDHERLLLTRYQGRSFQKYALVAGFNEIGESIEDTVRREVQEEVGLRVRDLRFYKSQPWVFTDTLLMGFFARLDGEDTITLQEDELSEGRWFSREALPQEHSAISLTGEMIEYFRRYGVPGES